MSLRNRIWNLDKGESSSLKTYFDSISWHHEEINAIVAQNWDRIKESKLLSKSIIRRMRAFYNSSYSYVNKLKREMGTEAGRYFEDLIFLPLQALIQEKFGEGVFKLEREKIIQPLGKRKPDIIVFYGDKPICVIECVVWLDRSRLNEMRLKHQICDGQNIFFSCIAGTVYLREESKNEIKGVVYWIMEKFFTDTKEYGKIDLVYPVEDVFEKILSKCKAEL